MEIQHKLHAEHAATCQDAAVDRLEVAQPTGQERRDQQAIIIMHQEIRVITEITIAPEDLVEKHTEILIKLLAIAVNISAAAAAAHLGIVVTTVEGVITVIQDHTADTLGIIRATLKANLAILFADIGASRVLLIQELGVTASTIVPKLLPYLLQ